MRRIETRKVVIQPTSPSQPQLMHQGLSAAKNLRSGRSRFRQLAGMIMTMLSMKSQLSLSLRCPMLMSQHSRIMTPTTRGLTKMILTFEYCHQRLFIPLKLRMVAELLSD